MPETDESMASTRDQLLQYLAPLIGLKLAIGRRAGDMRGFHFGQVTEGEKGSWGEFALHIHCSWRVEYEGRIFTGLTDLWNSALPDDAIDWKTWTYDDNPNLQDARIGEMLGGYDARTRSYVNASDALVVEHVDADEFGGVMLTLSGGYRIVVFPSGCEGDDWRMLPLRDNLTHLVIEGGRVRSVPGERVEDEDAEDGA